jgi:hypothetical protein
MNEIKSCTGGFNMEFLIKLRELFKEYNITSISGGCIELKENKDDFIISGTTIKGNEIVTKNIYIDNYELKT